MTKYYWLMGLAIAVLLGGVINPFLAEDLMVDVGYGLLIWSVLEGSAFGLALYVGLSLLGIGIALAVVPLFSDAYFKAFRISGLISAMFLYGGYQVATLPASSAGTVGGALERLHQNTLNLPMTIAAIATVGLLLQVAINCYCRKKFGEAECT